DRAGAMGAYMFSGNSGSVLGFVVGGALLALSGWQWVFLFNVPIGMVLYIAADRILPKRPKRESDGSFDLAGAITITIALMAFVGAVAAGGDPDTSLFELGGLMIVTVFFLMLFIRIEVKVAFPIVPLEIFREMTVAVPSAMGALLGVTSGTAV